MFEQLNKDVKKTVKDGINTDSMEFVALYDKKRGLWPDVIGKEIPVENRHFTPKLKRSRSTSAGIMDASSMTISLIFSSIFSRLIKDRRCASIISPFSSTSKSSSSRT